MSAEPKMMLVGITTSSCMSSCLCLSAHREQTGEAGSGILQVIFISVCLLWFVEQGRYTSFRLP